MILWLFLVLSFCCSKLSFFYSRPFSSLYLLLDLSDYLLIDLLDFTEMPDYDALALDLCRDFLLMTCGPVTFRE